MKKRLGFLSIVMIITILFSNVQIALADNYITHVTYGSSQGNIKEVSKGNGSAIVEITRDEQKDSSRSSTKNNNSGSSKSSKNPQKSESEEKTTRYFSVEEENGKVKKVVVTYHELFEDLYTTRTTQTEEVSEFNARLLHYNWYFTNNSTGESYKKEGLGHSIVETFKAGKWTVKSVPVYKWDYGYRTRTVTTTTYRTGTVAYHQDGQVERYWNSPETKTTYGPWTYYKLGEMIGEKTSGTRTFNFTISIEDEGKSVKLPPPREEETVGVIAVDELVE